MVRRRGRQAGRLAASSEVPNVYREMLAEASVSPTRSDQDGRSVKKRRVAGRVVATVNNTVVNDETKIEDIKPQESNDSDLEDQFEDVDLARQTFVRSESEDSADSDTNWEEVDDEEKNQALPEKDGPQALNLTLEASGRPERPKRKTVGATEKKLRLEIHKIVLLQILPRKALSYLNDDTTATQFQRSRSFMDGLEQASEAFRGRFRITARGLARPSWSDPDALPNLHIPDDIGLPMEKADFDDAAKAVEGSRDLGAQLFCALLRATGIDARLVCSLQPLQFRAVEKKQTPQRQYATIMPDTASVRGSSPDTEDGSVKARMKVPTKSTPKKPIRESKYPVFWVEAFNTAVQKWIPIDPLVTRTIAKPSKLEPPIGERENNLTYAIAFEDDGSARDVTRRYVKAYNAKTRLDRVESTKDGEKWWKRVMKLFRRKQRLDRDLVEDAELIAKEAAEPMPRNVQDFKTHPYYALERHLRRHEVIHPKREVGKVGAAGRDALEPIYRRRDVLHVQSADKWYRQGRCIKTGEQPLKRVVSRKRREVSNLEDDDEEVAAGTPLYAHHQTTLYTPAPVINGKVHKNAYGNLDIYVASMIPAGGAHIQHASTVRVAKLLGIDFAEAVVGFTFKGRHGTANILGAVVAAECVDAVKDVITVLEDERALLEQEKKSAEALAMWKRLLVGCRIRERISGYAIEGEGDQTDEERDEDEGMVVEEGGFMPDADAGPVAEPTANPTHTSHNKSANTPTSNNISLIPNTRPPPTIPVIFGPPLLPDPQPSASRHDTPTPTPTPSPPHEEDLFAEPLPLDDGGGGFLAPKDSDTDDTDAIQITHSPAQPLTQPPSPIPSAPPIHPIHPTLLTSTSTHKPSNHDGDDIDDADEESGEEQSEKGSLLSQDPDDEEEEVEDLEGEMEVVEEEY